MYPTIVIALVRSQRSMVDTYDLDVISTTAFHRFTAVPLNEGIPNRRSAIRDIAPTGQSVEEGGFQIITKPEGSTAESVACVLQTATEEGRGE